MYLKDFREQVWNCYRCSHGEYVGQWETKSKEFSMVCPSVKKFLWDNYACHGRMDCARALIEGKLHYNDRLLDAIYNCTLCAACDVQCKRMGIIKVLDVLETLRMDVVEKGYLKFPSLKKELESLAKYGNPFMVSESSERLKWIEELDFEIKLLPQLKAKVLLYVGSMYSLEPLVRDTLKSIVRVLYRSRVDFGILTDEWDDGLYALQIGDEGLFQNIAERNIKVFNSLSIETLVVLDPHAYNSFKRYYPRVGNVNAEILHITEFVERLINHGTIKVEEFQDEVVVTYHDPCNLGRICGVYDPPRNIINVIEGIELQEMERIKENSWCCGAGGGVMTFNSDFMRWTAQERVKEAELTGMTYLITACPFCEYSFKTATNARVLNIVELVERAMKVSSEGLS